VFVGEISTLIKLMRKNDFMSNDKTFRLLPLHSLLTSQEQHRVFETAPIGCTKVVVSTNIAETSLTIDDVTVVIETGKMKEMQYDSKTGMSQLVETWVSKANARQRAGRAGRVQPGDCYHMYSRQK
jgi:HrpA-like RNA helicase